MLVTCLQQQQQSTTVAAEHHLQAERSPRATSHPFDDPLVLRIFTRDLAGEIANLHSFGDL